MKKVLFSVLMLMGMNLALNAQVKISFDGPLEMEWQCKRCFVKGSTCVVDLAVTNTGNKELTSTLYWFPDAGTTGIMVYDDEGTVYKYDKVSGNYGGTNFGPSIGNAYNVKIPGDVTLKVRCQIKDFDEYAASIKTLKIPFILTNGASSTGCYLQVKDIPVSRE